MRGLLQRVTEASVSVNGRVVGQIGRGLCAFVGVAREDNEGVADRLATKIWQLRVFSDESGNMNRSAADLGLPVLVVSQFTLYADTSRGRRPSFVAAAPAARAAALIHHLVSQLQASGAQVATGRFGAMMQVAIVNDGPVTVLVES
jgi:D-aminoacyl-tRNA deacylase